MAGAVCRSRTWHGLHMQQRPIAKLIQDPGARHPVVMGTQQLTQQLIMIPGSEDEFSALSSAALVQAAIVVRNAIVRQINSCQAGGDSLIDMVE